MKRAYLLQLAIPALLMSASQAVVLSDSTPQYLDATSATRVFNVVTTGTVTSVIIDIRFEKYSGDTFGVNPGGTPYYYEMAFSLTSPSGTVVDLIALSSFDSGANGFLGTIVFDDTATQVVNFDFSTPVAGTFKPTDPDGMADFVGENMAGNWTLTITDTEPEDHLGYYSSNLYVNQAVPEPGSALLGGLASLALLRRRRSRA